MIDADRLGLVRLAEERAIEEELEQKHSRSIRKMVRAIEDYFVEVDYEEIVRDEDQDREEEETARYERQVALAQGIIVTRKTSAHLYGLVDRAIANMGMIPPKDLTINVKRIMDRMGEDLFNAFCVHAGDSVFISFTPMLLNLLEDEEIMDVIGHELGHAASRIPRYLEDYFYFAWGRWEEGLLDIDPDIPDRELERIKADVQEILDDGFDHETDAKIVRLMRLKEMTSDRFGLLASRSPDKSCSSLMRQETLGLDSRFFDYDYHHLMDQLDELGKMRKDPATRWLFDATHPVLPARIAAIEIFARSERYRVLTGGAAPVPSPVPSPSPDGTAPAPGGLLDTAMELQAIGEILRKSELVPEGEDLAEVRLVMCLFHRIVKGARNRTEPSERVVRRFVWEFYRDVYASIPPQVFEVDLRKCGDLVKTLGKEVSGKPLRDRKSLVRDIVGFVKDRHLMTRESRDQIATAASAMGLPKSIAITYLKRVGAWRRFSGVR